MIGWSAASSLNSKLNSTVLQHVLNADKIDICAKHLCVYRITLTPKPPDLNPTSRRKLVWAEWLNAGTSAPYLVTVTSILDILSVRKVRNYSHMKIFISLFCPYVLLPGKEWYQRSCERWSGLQLPEIPQHAPSFLYRRVLSASSPVPQKSKAKFLLCCCSQTETTCRLWTLHDTWFGISKLPEHLTCSIKVGKTQEWRGLRPQKIICINL